MLLEMRNVMMETLVMAMDARMILQSQLDQIGPALKMSLQNAGIVVMESSKT